MRELDEESQLIPWLDEQFDQLQKTAVSDMQQEGHDPQDLTFEPALDMRYLGQSHELTVPYSRQRLAQVFHTAHDRRFGYQRPSSRLEIVNIRLKVVANTPPLELDQQPIPVTSADPQPIGKKQVWFSGRPQKAALYQRHQLSPGQKIAGPAIIFQYDTTTVLPPAWQAEVDPFTNLVITRQPPEY
jgi:N-methylhydantoinase A